MKTMGSLEIEIINEDDEYYWITFPGAYRNIEVFEVPKSAVTEIHKGVDWSKVKKDVKKYLLAD